MRVLWLLLIGPRGTFYYPTVPTPPEQSRFSGNARSKKSEVRSITVYRISPTAPYQRGCYRGLIKQRPGGWGGSVELNMLLLQIKHQCNSNESGNGGRRRQGWSIKAGHFHRSIRPAVVTLIQVQHIYLRLRCTEIQEYIRLVHGGGGVHLMPHLLMWSG